MAHMRPFPRCRSALRNEPNFMRKWLSRRGGRRFEKPCDRGLGGGGLGGFLRRRGLEVLEGLESTEEHAVGSIDTPLNASKRLEGILVGVADGGIVLDGD